MRCRINDAEPDFGWPQIDEPAAAMLHQRYYRQSQALDGHRSSFLHTINGTGRVRDSRRSCRCYANGGAIKAFDGGCGLALPDRHRRCSLIHMVETLADVGRRTTERTSWPAEKRPMPPKTPPIPRDVCSAMGPHVLRLLRTPTKYSETLRANRCGDPDRRRWPGGNAAGRGGSCLILVATGIYYPKFLVGRDKPSTDRPPKTSSLAEVWTSSVELRILSRTRCSQWRVPDERWQERPRCQFER